MIKLIRKDVVIVKLISEEFEKRWGPPELTDTYFLCTDVNSIPIFELRSSKIISELTDDNRLEKVLDGEFFYNSGCVKDAVCIFSIIIASHCLTKANTSFKWMQNIEMMNQNTAVITQEYINRMVYLLLINSPYIEYLGGVIDKNHIKKIKRSFGKLLNTPKYIQIHFIGKMFYQALLKLENSIDDHNKRWVDDIVH